jgi:hypothetical protein
MELMGLGWILRYGGIPAACAWIFFWAIVSAKLGLWLNKWSRSAKSTKPVILFAIWLWIGWLLTGGISFAYDLSITSWIVVATVAGLVCCGISIMLIASTKLKLVDDLGRPIRLECELLSEDWLGKIIILLISSLLWVGGNLIIGNLNLIPLFTSERALLFTDKLGLKNVNEVKTAFGFVSHYGYPVQPYYYAIGQARLGNHEEAGRSFKLYAESLPVDQQGFWLGVSDFFYHNFASAESHFKNSNNSHGPFFALGSRFCADQLTLDDIATYVKTYGAHADDLELFHFLQQNISGAKKIREEIKSADVKSFDVDVIARLTELKKLLEEKRSNQGKPNESLNGSVNQGRQDEVPRNLSAAELANQRKNLRDRIEDLVQFWAYQNKPQLAELAQVKNASSNWWFIIFAYPLFASLLYGAGWILRDYGSPFSKAATMCHRLEPRWYRNISKRLVAQLAKKEPEDEKGLFSEEIRRINSAAFLTDILLGLWFNFKANRVLRGKKIDAEEREDLLFIHSAIRKLSGALVPYGHEQALSIITALRERADVGLQKHRKNQLDFVSARDELLAVQKELITLGDILEAFSGKPELTNFHLLGLEPGRNISDKEIKQAYRAVMGVIHPDRNQDNRCVENLAKLVNGAYAILGNPNRRSAYETTIRM